MSDTIVYVLALDLSADEARRRREDVVRWLTDERLFAVNPRHVRPGGSGEFVAGPDADGRATDEWPAGCEADVLCKRDVYTALELFEPPPCPACGSELDPDLHYELLHVWEQGGEPVAACGHCGRSALLGDWQWEYGAYVAELAVAFENWPEMKDEFLALLGSRLSNRWRTIVSRY